MKIVFYSDTVFSFGGVQRVLAVVAKTLSRFPCFSLGYSDFISYLCGKEEKRT